MKTCFFFYFIALFSISISTFAEIVPTKLSIDIDSIERIDNRNLGYKLKVEFVFKHGNLNSEYISSETIGEFPMIVLPSVKKLYSAKDLEKLSIPTVFYISKGQYSNLISKVSKKSGLQVKNLIPYKVNVLLVEQTFTHRDGDILFATAELAGKPKWIFEIENEVYPEEVKDLIQLHLKINQ